MRRTLTLLCAGLALACTPDGDGDADGGAGAGGGPGDAGPAPSSSEAIARAAVLFGSCVPDDGIARFVENAIYERRSTDTLRGALIDTVACLSGRADGCDGVEACTGIRVDLTGPCDEACDGEVFVACDDAWRFRFDCGRLGLRCSVDDGPCVAAEAAPAPCDVPDGDQLCQGGVPSICEGGRVGLGVPCAPHGLECAVDDFASATCRGLEGECMSESYGPNSFDYTDGRACVDDATLRACIGNGLHTVDCAAVGDGFRCFAPGDRPAYCGRGDACEPGSPARCDGDAVEVCVAGVLERVECGALGFDGCQGQGRATACVSPQGT